jgi:DNA replication protein DnaC
LAITFQVVFTDWTQIFGDERLTAALLDRLTHKAHILEFVGDSYRFRQRMRSQKGEEPKEIVLEDNAAGP